MWVEGWMDGWMLGDAGVWLGWFGLVWDRMVWNGMVPRYGFCLGRGGRAGLVPPSWYLFFSRLGLWLFLLFFVECLLFFQVLMDGWVGGWGRMDGGDGWVEWMTLAYYWTCDNGNGHLALARAWWPCLFLQLYLS